MTDDQSKTEPDFEEIVFVCILPLSFWEILLVLAKTAYLWERRHFLIQSVM